MGLSAAAPALPLPRVVRGGAWPVTVLILAYTFSYVDRTILSLMVGPIRASLHISDVQLSLLHGFAFAVFYTLVGIPLGRLVDQRRRTTIVAGGVFVWSLMTAACGFVTTFGEMFVARIGVGVGEAALSPAAYSMLADIFSGKALVRALSLFQSAIYVGGGIAAIGGGALLAFAPRVPGFEPWQLVFIIVGLPGILVAALALTMREPIRRGVSGADAPPFAAVLGTMRSQWRSYGGLILGLCFASLMWNGVAAWAPTHFIRAYGWTAAQAGVRYGSVLLVCGTAGINFGGWLAGRMRDRGWTDANVRLGVISALAALPFGVAAPLLPGATASLIALGGFLFAGAMPYGGGAAAFQDITPNRMRGQVSAIYLFALNLAGIGLGPTLVAAAAQRFFGGDHGISAAMAADVLICAPLSALILLLTLASYRENLSSEQRPY